MNDLTRLPTYTAEELAECSPAELVDLIIADADRVPRNVIDECVLRSEEMTKYLGMLHKDDFLWSEEEEGEDGLWWLRLHTVMILGLMPGESAGLLLVELIRRMSVEDDDTLQEWLDGYWPAFFQNKQSSVLPMLRDLCKDQELDGFMRSNAIDSVIASAAWQDDEALEQALVWLAEIVANEEEDWDFRLMAGNTLLNFPRPQYRQLLDGMASRQKGWGLHFSLDDVQHAYADLINKPEWEGFKNPWKFYEQDEISKRQIRWQEEDMQASLGNLTDDADDFNDTDFPDFDFVEPYTRPEPKIGRNDPCPCGSGKKYKKCCLAKE